MSLMKTFPVWAPTAIATEHGWCDPRTKEVYVSIKKLKSRLDAESKPVVAAKAEPVSVLAEVQETPEVKLEEAVIVETPKEEIKMEEISEENKSKRPYNKKPKVIGEAVEEPKGVKILGEVVEYNVEKQVIGE